jgi:hypothetical protein
MLVHCDAVEAELIAEFELVEVEIVGGVADLLVVVRVGERNPGALGVKFIRQRRIWEQMEIEDLHD